MSDSRCKIGATYIASPFDDLLGLFRGYKSERNKARDCAAEKGARIQEEFIKADPELHNKILGSYLTIIAGK